MRYLTWLIKPYFVFVIGCILFFASPDVLEASQQEAVFAGGCFWCLEHDLEDLPGVSSVESGYTGGDTTNPTYRDHVGHQEAVLLYFDPVKVSYKKLLRSYWRNVDPLDGEGQFCDRGDSYRPVIFTSDESQRNDAIESAEQVSKELNKPIRSIKVQIEEAKSFWLAEEYHQNFAENNRFKYKFYRNSCGRDSRLDEIWGKRARTNDEWLQ